MILKPLRVRLRRCDRERGRARRLDLALQYQVGALRGMRRAHVPGDDPALEFVLDVLGAVDQPHGPVLGLSRVALRESPQPGLFDVHEVGRTVDRRAQGGEELVIGRSQAADRPIFHQERVGDLPAEAVPAGNGRKPSSAS